MEARDVWVSKESDKPTVTKESNRTLAGREYGILRLSLFLSIGSLVGPSIQFVSPLKHF